MKFFYALICMALLLSITNEVRAESYDATKDYSCGDVTGGVWSYDGYRAEDGAYLPMLYGHAPLKEVSRYGIEARYLPDSSQPYYPFLTKFPDNLMCSPATQGKRFDAVLTWVAPRRCEVVLTGFAKLMGNLKGEAAGKKVKAFIVLNHKDLWSAEINGGETREFSVKTVVAAGDKVHMHIQNSGDKSGNITALNIKVEAVNK